MTRCIISGVVVTYLLAVVQTALGGRLAVRGVPPDLLFVWTVVIGLLSGRTAGALAGFGSGLLEGALTQAWIGALAISKTMTGFLAGVLATKLFRENWAVPSLSAVVLTIANEAIFLLVAWQDDWARAGRVVAVRVVYHAALAPVFFAVALRARRALVGRREELA